tara:strand:+ start:2792 stop:3964 length:1173 start_codon:yes stop_codon:yes gene_type:complete
MNKSEKEFIPYSCPDIGEEEIREVVHCMKSGWLTSGPKCREFEEKFSEFLGGDINTICVSSATAGLHLSLEALGITRGDEVITTTHTFTATAAVIKHVGADPIFVDIDQESYCIDINQIEKLITDKTKAILPVHFAGLAVDINAINKIAKKYNLFVIEDAAHALPTSLNGKIVGKLNSDVTVFSFYANKTITTGEGGMIATKDKKLSERIKKMRIHGIDRDAFNRFTSNVPAWKYDIVSPGYKYNMPDILAAIGIHQIKKINDFQKKREYIANIYDNNLSNLPIILPPKPLKDDKHAWHIYVIKLKKEVKIPRDTIIEKMFSFGIGCSVHYIPLHQMSYYKNLYNLKDEMFPQSQSLYERCISLPIYSKMREFEIEKVMHNFIKIIEDKK